MFVFFAKLTFIYGYNKPRIGNGEITPENLFQFVVNIENQKKWCSATIISKRHILTAAHCVIAAESSKIEFDTYKEYPEVAYWVHFRSRSVDNRQFRPPKLYLPRTYTLPGAHDIAIIEYGEERDFGIEPVKLTKDYIEKEGDEAYIAGYGLWFTNDDPTPVKSTVLRHTKISMIENCFGELKICGGNLTHLALSGDSGGPMMIYRNNQWYQIGVSASTGSYDMRTRISSYCNFIEDSTKNEVKCESIFPELIQKIPPQFPPIYKGQETPLNLFNFVIPLYNYFYNFGCTATVISKRHLLTTSFCTYQNWRTKDSELTFFNSYKSFSGKFFPDFRSKSINSNIVEPVNAIVYIPLNLNWPGEHNLVVIEFPEGTDFGVEPITLAKDHVQTYLENLIVVGYGKYEFKKNMHIDETPPQMRHTNVPFQRDRYFDEKVALENEFFAKDEGGPTLTEKNGKWYQITMNFIEGTPNGSHTVISPDCNFIEEATKNEVKCESVAPIYEEPYQPATTTTTMTTSLATQTSTKNQENEISVNSKPENNASTIEFQWILLIFLFTVFCF